MALKDLGGGNNTKSLIPSGGSLIFQVGANANDTLALNWSQAFTMTGIASQVFANKAITATMGLVKRNVDVATSMYGPFLQLQMQLIPLLTLMLLFKLLIQDVQP